MSISRRVGWRWSLGSVALSWLMLSGCEAVAPIDVCHDRVISDQPINETGDGNESISHPQAAADLGNGRIIVAFNSQSVDTDLGGVPRTSEVRIALVNAETGGRVVLCNGTGLETVVNEPTTFAYAASAARAQMDVGGRQAAALVSWTERSNTEVRIRMRFFDSAGCPLATSFMPYSSSAAVGSLVWSPASRHVLFTFQDERRVFASSITDAGPAPSTVIATGVGLLQSYAASALADDGSAFVVWNDLGAGPRGALLDATGLPTGATASPGLDLGFPVIGYQQGGGMSVSVAAGADRYAVFLDASVDKMSPPIVYLREFARDGSPLGVARLVSTADGQYQGVPSGVYVPHDMLAAIWQSRAHRGTVGRLFARDARPQFNALTCDENPFRIGGDTSIFYNTQSPLMVGDWIWVFYTGELARDSRGTAVGLWRIAFRELWPGRL